MEYIIIYHDKRTIRRRIIHYDTLEELLHAYHQRLKARWMGYTCLVKLHGLYYSIDIADIGRDNLYEFYE